jgi:hypothetical protein
VTAAVGIRSAQVSWSAPAELGAASSPSAAVTTPAVPASPPNLLVRAGDRSAVVDWGVPAVNGPPVTGYTVTVVPPVPGAIIQVAGAAATVLGLTNGAMAHVHHPCSRGGDRRSNRHSVWPGRGAQWREPRHLGG